MTPQGDPYSAPSSGRTTDLNTCQRLGILEEGYEMWCTDLSGPMMMPTDGMGPQADAKQRMELSKEGVGPAAEPPKPKVFFL